MVSDHQAFDPDVYNPNSCSSVSPGWVAAILYMTSLVVVACLIFIYHQMSKSAASASASDAEDTPLSSSHDWSISCLFVRPTAMASNELILP